MTAWQEGGGGGKVLKSDVYDYQLYRKDWIYDKYSQTKLNDVCAGSSGRFCIGRDESCTGQRWVDLWRNELRKCWAKSSVIYCWLRTLLQ